MIKWINKKRNKKGFTLVELVVVIAILGILAALAIPRLTGARYNATGKTHDSNIRMIESAVEIYYAEFGKYPKNMTALEKENLIKNEIIEVPKGLENYTDHIYTTENGSVGTEKK